MKDRIRLAFDQIHTDDALINSTKAYVCGKLDERRDKGKSFAVPTLAQAFAFIVVFTIGVFAYGLYFTADAHVSIDVNPSVELTLNRFDRVIGTHAFNIEGERILSATGLRGKTYEEAAGLILAAVKNGGYLTEDTLVSVTVQTANSAKEQLLRDHLQEMLGGRVLSLQTGAEVEVFAVTQEVWSSAHGCHMSPAKYLAIQELMEVDEGASIEDYSNSSVSQIRRHAQECRRHNNTEAGHSGSVAASSGGHRHGH